jgi:Protein of unknown function (DUF3455)
MYHNKIKGALRLLVLLTVAGLALQPISIAKAVDNDNGPELPAGCGSIQVEAGNKLAFHAYARGVQIYIWNGTSWDFDAPRAGLFAEANFFGEVGTHYKGPKWESKSGSKVQAARVPGTGCTPDSTAIAWLLLEKVSTTGPGIFANTTFIQRVNTTGGLAPTEDGSSIGEVKEVPYTAEYYFYRAGN